MGQSSVVRFALACVNCRGRGFVALFERDGWPRACECRGRVSFTQYSLGRLLGVRPSVIVNVHRGVARARSCEMVLAQLSRNLLSFESAGAPRVPRPRDLFVSPDVARADSRKKNAKTNARRVRREKAASRKRVTDG